MLEEVEAGTGRVHVHSGIGIQPSIWWNLGTRRDPGWRQEAGILEGQGAA